MPPLKPSLKPLLERVKTEKSFFSQIGRFKVSREMLERHHRTMQHIMAHMIIIDVQCDELIYDRIEYTAYSDLFDSIGPNEAAPLYDIEVTTSWNNRISNISAHRFPSPPKQI